ncbi:MAG: hypothetical protein WBA16_03505 [Nonlabens sp.]
MIDSIVFTPAGMQNAAMKWSQIDSTSFAKWYNSKGEAHDTNYKIEKVNAADDMLVSMKDLAKFCKSILNNGILRASTFREMTQPQSSINRKLDQGLGWIMFD